MGGFPQKAPVKIGVEPRMGPAQTLVRLRSLLLILALFALTSTASADSRAARASGSYSLGDLRRAEAGQEPGVNSTLASKPISVGGGSTITLLTPPAWAKTGAQLVSLVKRSHERYQDLFGEIPAFTVTLRLLEEETFFLSTGAPRWTNALFYRGQILIPVPATGALDTDNLLRSVRHEYTHAIIHALSDGKAPGWVDEGLAQLAEGPENPALRPALYEYLRTSSAVPFRFLQGGFTKLDMKMVAAAYAESLIASQALVETFGFQKVGQYFALLRGGAPHVEAFAQAFSMSEGNFESRFSAKLSRWADTYAVMNNPPEEPGAEAAPEWDERSDMLKARGL